MDAASVVAQESFSLFSALACGLWRLVDDEARRWLSYLQEQELLRDVGEPCLDMLLNRCPQTFFYFLIMHLVGFLHIRRGQGHVQSSEPNAERYFPSMFYGHCKITFLKLDLHSPLFIELCRVSNWTRHNILACKTLGLLQITLNWVMECILEAVTIKIRLSNDLLGSLSNF